jgi:hypothetical protein
VGFFSIWITVFQADSQMVSDLMAAFTGTASDRLLPLPDAG